MTALSHCDGCGMKDGINDLVAKVKKLSIGSPDGRCVYEVNHSVCIYGIRFNVSLEM